VAVGVQAEDFEPEQVQPVQPCPAERADDVPGLGGGLPAADRPDSDPGRGGQVDPGHGPVQVDAPAVVVGGLALHDGDDVEVGGQVTQQPVVGDGEALVLGHGPVGIGEPLPGRCAAVSDDVLTHPVLRGGPHQAADLVAVAA
jgi:hypothetical protein